MPLSKNDVSEYVTPDQDPARLVVTLTPLQGSTEKYDVTAEIDDKAVMTGQFVISPQWLASTQRVTTSKAQRWWEPTGKIGDELFSAIFSGSLSRAWAQAVDRARLKGGLHIVIRSRSHAVQALPWELLSDTALTSAEHVAIAEGWSVLRDIRVSGPDVMVTPRTAAAMPIDDVRVAVITTRIPGIDQDSDIGIVSDSFGMQIVRPTRDADARTVIRHLASDEADVIHILGTGRGGRQQVQDLVFFADGSDEFGVIRAKDLVKAAASNKRVRLVVLAACETDLLAAELASVVPVVIGIRGTISDAGCQAFLHGLYRALASGSTVSQAVASGRSQQIGFSQSLADEWAHPVVYLSTDTAIVLPSPRVEPPPAQAVDAPGGASPEERSSQLLRAMKQANLQALNVQWGDVEQGDVPLVIRDQIDRLTVEVDGLGGDSS